jgi:hypothetical protein
MKKLRDEGVGRYDVPQQVSGSDLWPSSTGTHLHAQRSTDCISSRMKVVQQKKPPKAAALIIADRAIELRQQS